MSTTGPVQQEIAPAPPCALPPTDPHRWFRDEVHPHDGALKAYLRSAFPSARSEVEDIVQESYLRIWKVRASQTIQSARGFLFTLARHVALDLRRRQIRSPINSLGDLAALNAVEDRAGVVEMITQQEKIVLLGRAVAALPDRCREIIILHKFKGVPQADIAFMLRTTPKAVERQVAHGVKRCEEFIRKHGHEHF